MTEHSETCKKAQEARTKWLETYPNHCTKCMGTGVIVTGGDRVDYGSTTVSLPDWNDPCETCWGHCPRCGEAIYSNEDDAEKAFENGEGECPFCGWNWGKGKDDYCPEVDCWCGYEQAEKHLDDRFSGGDDWLESAYDDPYPAGIDY